MDHGVHVLGSEDVAVDEVADVGTEERDTVQVLRWRTEVDADHLVDGRVVHEPPRELGAEVTGDPGDQNDSSH
jgi:hypothetical protein